MRRFRLHAALIGVLLLALGAGSYAVAGGGKSEVKADGLTGYQENPDVSSVAFGSFEARIDDDAQEIDYVLTYTDIETPVQQAHIHFGKRAVNGGISVFFCTNLGNGPAGTPTCPSPSGTVTGTIRPADIIGPNGQGIEPGAFGELVQAIRAGHTYANVHSMRFPGGEIRAQVNDQNERDDD